MSDDTTLTPSKPAPAPKATPTAAIVMAGLTDLACAGGVIALGVLGRIDGLTAAVIVALISGVKIADLLRGRLPSAGPVSAIMAMIVTAAMHRGVV